MPEQNEASEHPNLRIVRAYLAALESGAPAEALADFFAPDLRQRELPNRLVPEGVERTLAQALAGRKRGLEVVRDERYAIENAVVEGDRVAVELVWTARLQVPLGDARPGDPLRASCGMFFTLAGGRIARQSNYDCFAPF